MHEVVLDTETTGLSVKQNNISNILEKVFNNKKITMGVVITIFVFAILIYLL